MELSQVLQALRNADAAGDVQGAKRLAEIAQSMAGMPAAPKPPEPTMGGHLKEFFKGIPAGGVGLLETAATGASALLPEEAEKATREFVKDVAGKARKPFEANKGYEEAVSRRLGEGVGSFLPVAPLGVLGAAGRIAGVGLGLAAGAGEARTGAEAEGATKEQRGTATALGAIPGAFDTAVDMALGAFPGGKGLGFIKRALVTGGIEGATEAAQKVAQNAIAKGVYKPEQSLIEGSGEEGAYGAGVGALASLILDAVIPGRGGARAPAPVTPGQAPQGDEEQQKRREAKAQEQIDVATGKAARAEAALTTAKGKGVQGQLFAGLPNAPEQRDLFGNLVAPPTPEEAAPAAPEAPTVPEGQMDLGLEATRSFQELETEKQQLLALKDKEKVLSRKLRTPGINERLEEIATQQKEFVRLSNKAREGTQGALFTPQDLAGLDTEKGVGVTPVAVPKQTRQRAGAAPTGEQLDLGVEATREYADLVKERERLKLEPKTPENKARLTDLNQQIRDRDLYEVDRLRGAPVEEQPVTEPTLVKKPEPLTPQTVPTVVTPDVLGALGIGRTATIRKADHGIMGKDITDPAQAGEVKSILEAYRSRPNLSPAIAEKVDAYLARPEFEAVAPTETATQGETDAGQAIDTTGGTSVQALEPTDTGSAAGTVEPTERDGMVPAGADVEQPVVGEGQQAPTVETAPAETPAKEAPARANMFEQLVAREKNPDAPEVIAEGRKLKSLPDDVEAFKEAFMEDLYKKKHPFDLPGRNLMGSSTPEARGAEATTNVQAALQEKAKAGDVRGALQAILDAPDGVYNELDKLVAKRLLSAGSLPTIEVVPQLESGADGSYNAETDHVLLAEGSLGSHTLLHELVHGFVHRIIGLHEGGVSKNMHVGNLRQLFDHIAKQNPELMQEYGMTNLSEFASEVMSNKDFQEALQKIPYRRENAFTAFAKSVLRILGISPTDQNTALGSALISVEAVMGEGRRYQEAAKGTRVEGSLPGVANVAVGIKQSDLDEVQRISASFGPEAAPAVNGLINEGFQSMNRAAENGGMLQAFRQAAVDKFASVESKISNMFSQGVRDAFGNLNPMVLVRQAEDHAKVFMSFLSDGGIRFNKEGLVETYKQEGSAVAALTKINDLAKTSGVSFDQAKTYVSSVLEGHRAYDIQQNWNNELENSARILEKQGKTKEADAERAKKIKLHLTAEQITTLENLYQKSPEIKDIQDTFNQTRTAAIDLMVQSGRLSKEQGEDWKANSAYVPFNRVMEVLGENPMPRGKGLGVMTKLPQIKGSLDKRVKDVVDSYMGTLGWMTEEAMRHNASTRLLDEMALAGYAEKLPAPTAAKNKNLVVRLFEGGKPVYYEVQNEYDMLAFQQAPEINNWLVKGLAATSRALRVSVTAMPPFAVKQVIEDATRAAMYSGVQRPLVVAMKTLYNMPRIFFGEVMGRKSPAAKRMEELGIVGDYDFNIYQPTNEIEKEIGAKKRGVAGSIFHTLEKFTKASDLAARLAVYEETMRDSNGDEVLAQTRARELINFNRRGSSSSMRLATRVVPFFNAYAQGMDVLYRSASGIDSSSSVDRASARRMFIGRVALMTAMGFAYAMAMSDDDGYKNATDDVRDSNWLLPNGYKLPTPKEVGFLYKVIPERIVSYFNRLGGPEEQSAMDALAGIVKAGYSAYSSPTAVPSYVRPILENMTNYSFFLQRELESASLQGKVPGERFTSSTSELAKSIGQATNVSPIKIDNLLRGMFGMAGSTTLLATDAILNPTRPDRPLYQMPFGSIFLYDTVGGRNKTEFYDLRERSAQAVTTFNDLLDKDPARAEKFFERNQGLIGIAPALNSKLEQLNDLRRMRTLLEQGNEEMLGVDSAERRKLIDELRSYENEVTSDIRLFEKAVRDAQ